MVAPSSSPPMRWPTSAPLTRHPSRSRVPSHSSLLRLKVFIRRTYPICAQGVQVVRGRSVASGDIHERWGRVPLVPLSYTSRVARLGSYWRWLGHRLRLSHPGRVLFTVALL